MKHAKTVLIVFLLVFGAFQMHSDQAQADSIPQLFTDEITLSGIVAAI